MWRPSIRGILLPSLGDALGKNDCKSTKPNASDYGEWEIFAYSRGGSGSPGGSGRATEYPSRLLKNGPRRNLAFFGFLPLEA
jgi:hypothetical protein